MAVIYNRVQRGNGESRRASENDAHTRKESIAPGAENA
jgi:hypothetical protein